MINASKTSAYAYLAESLKNKELSNWVRLSAEQEKINEKANSKKHVLSFRNVQSLNDREAKDVIALDFARRAFWSPEGHVAGCTKMTVYGVYEPMSKGHVLREYHRLMQEDRYSQKVQERIRTGKPLLAARMSAPVRKFTQPVNFGPRGVSKTIPAVLTATGVLKGCGDCPACWAEQGRYRANNIAAEIIDALADSKTCWFVTLTCAQTSTNELFNPEMFTFKGFQKAVVKYKKLLRYHLEKKGMGTARIVHAIEAHKKLSTVFVPEKSISEEMQKGRALYGYWPHAHLIVIFDKREAEPPSGGNPRWITKSKRGQFLYEKGDTIWKWGAVTWQPMDPTKQSALALGFYVGSYASKGVRKPRGWGRTMGHMKPGLGMGWISKLVDSYDWRETDTVLAVSGSGLVLDPYRVKKLHAEILRTQGVEYEGPEFSDPERVVQDRINEQMNCLEVQQSYKTERLLRYDDKN